MSKGSSIVDALNIRDLNRLIETAARLQKFKFAFQATTAIVLMGYLGLRFGECLHIMKNPRFIDTESQTIMIPDYIECECTYCEHLARKYAERNEDISYEEALKLYWKPKTDSGFRTIPYGAFPDIVINVIERYFQRAHVEEEAETMTASKLYRRIKLVSELTPGIDRERLSGRVLRATAASRLARLGVSMAVLKRIFGWRFPHVAAYYMRMSGVVLEREVRRIHLKPPQPDARFIRTLKYRPPTFIEWRTNFPYINPPRGYTPTEGDRPGQLEVLDDEEYLIKQGTLQEFTKDMLAPLAGEEPDMDNEKHADDRPNVPDHVDDETEILYATFGPVADLVVSNRYSRYFTGEQQQKRNEVGRHRAREYGLFNKIPERETAAQGLGAWSLTTVAMGWGFGQVGIGLDPMKLQLEGPIGYIGFTAVALLVCTSYTLYRLMYSDT